MKKLRDLYKETSKISFVVYIVLRLLVILCMVRELMNGNFENVLLCVLSLILFLLPIFIEIENALLCVLSLILFLLPVFIEKTFKIDLPTPLEVIILIFIFSAEILGEINNFYGMFHNFDDILHTINGFLAASVGFSLIYLLNENTDKLKLSPFFVSLVAFCFSMTIGVAWEFFEYGMDRYFGLDMQKDEYVERIKTVTLDPEQKNQVVTFDNIKYTVIYDENDQPLTTIEGYLDIGLNDTMKDLIVNFIGATVFSALGYLYIVNRNRYSFAGVFLTKKKE